jgi:hypothetical protein
MSGRIRTLPVATGLATFEVSARTRELALFDLGIESKLRACDLLKLKVRKDRSFPQPLCGLAISTRC